MKYNEIFHFAHPQHKVKLEYSEVPYKCDGCKEAGIGTRYKCGGGGACDFDLHTHCAVPSPTISHPFYPKCSFRFLSRPPGNLPRYCNACEKDVTGFVYHCTSCGFDLHPCCAKLPMVLDDGETKLHLYRKVSSSCHRCGHKGRSWSYRSTCKTYNLHVACVREMLMESWSHVYQRGTRATTRTTSSSSSSSSSSVVGPTGPLSLKNTLQTYHSGKSNKSGGMCGGGGGARNKKKGGKAKKCCEMAGLAVQCVISAVLGDPTALIAGLIGTLISRA